MVYAEIVADLHNTVVSKQKYVGAKKNNLHIIKHITARTKNSKDTFITNRTFTSCYNNEFYTECGKKICNFFLTFHEMTLLSALKGSNSSKKPKKAHGII